MKKEKWSQKKRLIFAFIGFIFLAYTIALAYSIGLLGEKGQKTINNTTSSAAQRATVDDKRFCNTPMKDGTYETTRCNDLDELCKDYLFYRKKILQANQEGDMKKVNEYRVSFQKVNAWLSRYKESDVQNTFSRLENQ